MKRGFLLLVFLVSVSAHSYTGWVDVRSDVGSRRYIQHIRPYVPLSGSDLYVLMGVARGNFDFNDHIEGDFGLLYRRLVLPKLMGGCYAFFDTAQLSSGNAFHQVTLGLEARRGWLGCYINGYLPLTGIKCVDDTTQLSASIQGGGLAVSGFLDDEEAPLYGTDGALQLFLGSHLKLQAGGYIFARRGFTTHKGPRARAEWKHHLGHGVKVAIGVEGHYDNIRQGRLFGYLQLSIPLRMIERGGDGCSWLTETLTRHDIIVERRRGHCFSTPARFQNRTLRRVATWRGEPSVDADLVIVDGYGRSETFDMQEGQIVVSGGTRLAVMGEGLVGLFPITLEGEAGVMDVQQLKSVDGALLSGIEVKGDIIGQRPGSFHGITASSLTLQTATGCTIDGCTFGSVTFDDARSVKVQKTKVAGDVTGTVRGSKLNNCHFGSVSLRGDDLSLTHNTCGPCHIDGGEATIEHNTITGGVYAQGSNLGVNHNTITTQDQVAITFGPHSDGTANHNTISTWGHPAFECHSITDSKGKHIDFSFNKVVSSGGVVKARDTKNSFDGHLILDFNDLTETDHPHFDFVNSRPSLFGNLH